LCTIPLLLVLIITLHVLPANAHVEGSAIQQIQQNGILMQFSYYPSSPVINGTLPQFMDQTVHCHWRV
ncbi:MAG: hypothetical protein KGH99_02675, partial [Thaumarchaeota archaeon]|nr:hypothetical protein [Nitrososphaerota archaeon]